MVFLFPVLIQFSLLFFDDNFPPGTILGQFYTVALEDSEEYDGDITSVIKVTFHDASHRRLAAPYWSFWLSQQANPKTARALDIGKK